MFRIYLDDESKRQVAQDIRFCASHLQVLLFEVCGLGTSDFDAQMFGKKLWEGDENLTVFEILSGCFHFGLFSS
jgi:hypothetical protein